MTPPACRHRRDRPHFVDQSHDDLLASRVITGHGNGETARRAFRRAEYGEGVVQDAVERFDDRAPKLLRDPDTFRHTCINLWYLRVAYSWKIVADVNDADVTG